MTDQIHPSVPAIWFSFIADNIEHSHTPMPDAYPLGTTQEQADTCVLLVKAGLKTASSGALASYLHYEVPIPQVGDMAILTNWEGEAQCILQTTHVELVPFDEVEEDYAMKEGEGDQSLSYWKKQHWAFFSKDLASFGEIAEEDMMVVCEEFEVIYQLP